MGQGVKKEKNSGKRDKTIHIQRVKYKEIK